MSDENLSVYLKPDNKNFIEYAREFKRLLDTGEIRFIGTNAEKVCGASTTFQAIAYAIAQGIPYKVGKEPGIKQRNINYEKSHLNENEIFVFGSNIHGIHAGVI